MAIVSFAERSQTLNTVTDYLRGLAGKSTTLTNPSVNVMWLKMKECFALKDFITENVFHN